MYYVNIQTAVSGVNIPALCDKFSWSNKSGSSLVNGEFLVNSKLFNFKHTDSATLSDWKTWLSTNPIQIYYQLATPFTLYISPEQLKLLKSQNTITTSNYTQVKVTYRNGVFATLEELSDTAQDIYDEISGDTTTVSGNPINFTTREKQKSKSTIIDLEPIQDLHGFTKPWVGGAGKNLLPMTVENIKTNNTAGTWTENVYEYRQTTHTVVTDNDGNVIGIKINGTATGGNSGLSIPINNLTTGASYILTGTPYDNHDVLGVSVSGIEYATTSGLQFTARATTEVVNITLMSGKSLANLLVCPMVRLATVVDSSFEPYENLCPITGRSSIDIDGCGKNLFDLNKQDFIQRSGVTTNVTVNNNTITISSSSASMAGYAGFLFEVEIEKTYTITYETSSNKIRTIQLDEPIDVITTEYGSNTDSGTAILATKRYLLVNLYGSSSNQCTYSNIQVEQNSQATIYEPYTPSTDLTISFGTTVYGGRLDVEKGELVVDRAIVDMGDLNWTDLGTAVSGAARFKTTLTNKPVRSDLTNGSTSYCSHYDLLSEGGTYTANKDGYTISTTDIVFFVDAYKTSSTSAFKTAMSGVQVVYTLQDEYKTTIQLTPHQIQLLKGINNISTDGTTITVTYKNGSVAHLDDLDAGVFDPNYVHTD
jgi:hypothetical protein